MIGADFPHFALIFAQHSRLLPIPSQHVYNRNTPLHQRCKSYYGTLAALAQLREAHEETTSDVQAGGMFSLSDAIQVKLLYTLLRRIYVYSPECTQHTRGGN